MKKKIMLVALFFLTPCLFAAVHEVSLYASIYSYQAFTASAADMPTQHSEYGFGARLGYSLYPVDEVGFFLGFDGEFLGYVFKDKDKLFIDWPLYAKFGYDFVIAEKFAITPVILLGADIQNYTGVTSVVFAFGPMVQFRYFFGDNWSFEFQTEGIFGFSKKDGVNYGNYKVDTFMGLGYRF